MHDLDDDAETESTYECLACGGLVTAVIRPGDCPDCGEDGKFRNRAFAPE